MATKFGLTPLNEGGLSKAPSKLMRPTDEQNTVPISEILKKNKGALKKRSKKAQPPSRSKPPSKDQPKRGKLRKGGKIKGAKGGKPPPKGKGKAPRKRGGKRDGKGKRGKRGRKGKQKAQREGKEDEAPPEPDVPVDPYVTLKETDPQTLIKMFLHKLIDYPLVSDHLGQFGNQLQSSMINFARDMILPTLMDPEHVQRFASIVNDRKLIYLLRQSFIRWLMVHRGQMKLVFKPKGQENAKDAIKYDIVVTKNHIIQKLASTLATDTADENATADLKDILSKLPTKTKLAYVHYLRSDMKNPFLAQLQTPIPNRLLPNTKCNVPSISGKMPEIKKQPEMKNAEDLTFEEAINQQENVSKRLHSVFEGYKDCVLLSEKQVLVDILKTQYKLIQNAIDDYGRIRWMDVPLDHGHIGLMQRELIRDHQMIIRKCAAMEADYQKRLEEAVEEVNKMRAELTKRKDQYLHLIENQCFRFLKCKLSAIHEEIERKKQAIALHEKKRENYLNHAKESLKNEQNMRKGVDLVEQTYHKYLRQLTKAKVEYAVIDEKLDSDSFYVLQEKLNALRNKNDRYWYWYKKEKEIYSNSIQSFSRLNRFFRKVDRFLEKEYGQESHELSMFRDEYYEHVLQANVDQEQLDNDLNKEIFDKKKLSDIEIVYNLKAEHIKLPREPDSVMNRLYMRMKPKVIEEERNDTDVGGVLFLNNKMRKDQDIDDVLDKTQKEEDEEQWNKEQHVNVSDEEQSESEMEAQKMDDGNMTDQTDQSQYIKTGDDDIFGMVAGDEHLEDGDVIEPVKKDKPKKKKKPKEKKPRKDMVNRPVRKTKTRHGRSASLVSVDGDTGLPPLPGTQVYHSEEKEAEADVGSGRTHYDKPQFNFGSDGVMGGTMTSIKDVSEALVDPDIIDDDAEHSFEDDESDDDYDTATESDEESDEEVFDVESNAEYIALMKRMENS